MSLKSLICFLLLCTSFSDSFSQEDTIQSRIILIGDAGKLTNGRHPVISAVRNSIPLDEKTTVLFLGDNLYKTGLPDDIMPTYELAKAPLDSQIEIAKGTKAKVYFMPGNHDWNNGSKNGYSAILREQRYVDVLANNNVQFLPQDGCPGPVEISITKDITVLIMDSQWWIHEYDKPGIESDCPYKTKEEVITRIDDILSKNSKKLVIFAFHHPLRSYGIHGGYFTLKQHIFPFTDAIPNLYIPLPLIGSIYPITRGIFGTAEDLAHPLYAAMIGEMDKLAKDHDNIIFAAGHEHSLQLIQDSGKSYIVSGSGSKSTRVYKGHNSVFRSEKQGFAVLEISTNKNVTCTFYTAEGFNAKKEKTFHLLNFSKLPEDENRPDSIRIPDIVFKDSAVIPASRNYGNASGFKEIVLGENYRKEWSTPVQFKVFNLRKEKGGLTITRLGGGKQTKSLRLTDKNGTDWTLRSIDKDPENAIPEMLRGTLAQRIVQDMISASHPYAPLVVSGLAKSAGVTAASPEFFFVPDDPSFGIYRDIFANKVSLLEEREPTLEHTDTKTTGKIINKLIEDHDDHVNQNEYLKARLLDNLIGDWDRHFDQWRWGTSDTGKGKLYYPIPRDRDQAFFYSDGLLAKYLTLNLLRYLQGFKRTIPDVNWFNWEARDLDRMFLNQLEEEDWKKTIDSFQQALPDTAIARAITNLPPEIYRIDAPNIQEKLESSRDELMKKGLKYYRFISKRVTVTGSNQRENFALTQNGENLELNVYKMKRFDTTGLMYHRVFDPAVTKEIRLFGSNGSDKFYIAPDVKSKIKIRMIGGKGADTFNVLGNIKNYIYDITLENNGLINKRRSRVEFSPDPMVNEYKTNSYEYNIYRFPQLKVGYNPEDQLLLGVGFSIRTFGFRKDPYATDQKLSSLFAFSRKAYQLKYSGIFNSILFKNDLLVNAQFVNPTLNNFFGLGNETDFDKSKSIEFYRVRYKYVSADVLMRKRLNDIVSYSIGPSYYRYWIDFEDNKTRILGSPALLGVDSASIYSSKDYLGAKLKFDINYVNNDLFPTRGITWYTELSSMFGMNATSKNVTRLTSDMTVYASLSEDRKLMAVMRFGAGRIFNKDFQYFQALNLGFNNYIRGFRKNRFSGSSLAYGSAEVRIKLFRSQSYILPGDVGVIGFYDIGRVWQYGESSKKWHQSYGGGLYYTPFNVVIVSATMGISNEDNLINFSVGTKFNITF
ncbi:metallophosphoesterase [soil metagenome]